MNENMTVKKEDYDQIYNWKISVSDVLYQVRYFIEQGMDFELGSKEGTLHAMKHLGFDITQQYNVTKNYTHRNIRKDIVTCGFIEGFADKVYLDKHGIKPVEYMIQTETDDTVQEQLKGIFKQESTVSCETKKELKSKGIDKDKDLSDIKIKDDKGRVTDG